MLAGSVGAALLAGQVSARLAVPADPAWLAAGLLQAGWGAAALLLAPALVRRLVIAWTGWA
jgi:hypothetical protein